MLKEYTVACSVECLNVVFILIGDYTRWLSGKQEGYCGVGLYSKEKPLKVKHGLGDKTQDEEARIITAEFEKFFVVTACESAV